MKNLFIALPLTLTLGLAATAASADAFAPWDARMPAVDHTDATPAMVAPSGFAPWRDRAVRLEMPDGVQLGVMPHSVFRPWS